MVDFNLESGNSFTTALVVLAAAILLVAAFYYRAFGMLRSWQWPLLLSLRTIAILMVVLLLFRPALTYHKDLQEKPGIVFLVDRSKSMSISDDASGASRFQLARQQVEKWWQRLKDDFELVLVEFSERAQPLEGVQQLAAAKPDGAATSLSRALVMAVDKIPHRANGVAILLSDGLHNSARNPLEVASKMGMPVHTVGVGASLRSNASYRDLQVTGIDCPDRLMLNNKARITGSIEGIGLGGHVTKVILEDEGQQIQEVELTLDDVEGSQKVDFDFVPTVKGRHTYTVRVPAGTEEKVIENNKRSAVAMVIEPGIRVLYIEGTLRGEYGALVDRFLSKDPDLQFCALIQTRKNFFLQRTNIPDFKLETIPNNAEMMNKFDVFIFGDLDASFVKPDQQGLIVKRVQEGGGLIMLGGYHSLGPGGYDGTPIGNILPVRLGGRNVGQVDENFLPLLTPEASVHPIFANINTFFPTKNAEPKVAGLPTLDGCTRVEAAKPDALVLATHPVAGNDMPVFAVHSVGKGHTAVFTGDTTRKWQQGPRALDRESPFLQFWGQTIRWLAGRSKQLENQASVTATADKGYYEPEEPVKIEAIVRDQKGEGANDAAVVADVAGPGGRADKVTLTNQPGAPGHYAGSFEPKAPGKYEVVVQAKVGDAHLKTDKITVEVGRPNLEFEKLDLDEKMLQRIAADSGGRYVHISTADHLVDQLDKTQRKKRLYYEKRLYWPSGFWVIFVGVLTAEWVLRKRFQLR